MFQGSKSLKPWKVPRKPMFWRLRSGETLNTVTPSWFNSSTIRCWNDMFEMPI